MGILAGPSAFFPVWVAPFGEPLRVAAVVCAAPGPQVVVGGLSGMHTRGSVVQSCGIAVHDMSLAQPGHFNDIPRIASQSPVRFQQHGPLSYVLEHGPVGGRAETGRGLDDIKNLANEAAILAARKKRSEVLMQDFEDAVDKKQAEEDAMRIMSGEFTLDDFLEQMQQLKKMGPLTNLMGMLPGLPKEMRDVDIDDREVNRIEAIINSMTPHERRQHAIINGSRRKRIAKGSGTRVQDVNKLLKSYAQILKMMKKINKGGMRGLGRGMLPF